MSTNDSVVMENLEALLEEEPKHDPDNCSMLRVSGCDVCDCGAIRPEFDVGDHDLFCDLIQNQKATRCSCGGFGPNHLKKEYTLVGSEHEPDLLYIREGDGSHSNQDVARVYLNDNARGQDLIAFLTKHMKVK